MKCLLASGTADSHSLFTVEGEFLLEANVKGNFSNRSRSQTLNDTTIIDDNYSNNNNDDGDDDDATG